MKEGPPSVTICS